MNRPIKSIQINFIVIGNLIFHRYWTFCLHVDKFYILNMNLELTLATNWIYTIEIGKCLNFASSHNFHFHFKAKITHSLFV